MLVLKPNKDESIIIKDTVMGEIIVEIVFFYQGMGRLKTPSRRLGFTADKRYNIYREKHKPESEVNDV